MTRTSWIVAGVVAAFGTFTFARADGELGDAAKGKAPFDKHCAPCHGVSGKGDGSAGSVLEHKPRNFTDASVMHKLSDAHLIKVISLGGAAVGKSTAMPPWGDVLSEQQVRDVAAYIRSFAPMPE